LKKLRKAVFLDRDGVINRDTGYVFRWADFEFAPGAIAALRRLTVAGFPLIVITNQSGVARGYYTEQDVQTLTQQMTAYLASQGVTITATYYCPHHTSGTIAEYARACDCRKPGPALLLQAASAHDLSLGDSIMIGDKESDIKAARAAGVGIAYLIDAKHSSHVIPPSAPNGVFADLAACVDYFLA
jgi:D-glycero-D-manno-heptose 1,7-bisphosphate phosphatase